MFYANSVHFGLTLNIIGFAFQLSSNFYGNTKTNNSSDNVLKFEPNATSDKTLNLIGEWGIYVMGNAQCNVCPKINFNSDRTAIVKLNGENQNVKWEIKGNILTLVNADTNKVDRTFSDGEYGMKFMQEKEFVELQLTETKNKYSYTLRR